MDKKWNLQDIRPADTSAKRAPKRAPRSTAQNTSRQQRKPNGSGSRSRLSTVSITVAVFIAVGAIFIGFVYSGTKITVTPRSDTQTINAKFTAYNDPPSGELGYERMMLTASDQRLVTATGEESVSEQATGEILIENTGESSERLIKNTRFESPDGLVFRITESVVVPSAETVDGEVIPGQVTATVFADEPGEEYNIDPSTFTIPGYAEGGFDTLFEQVTGRSTTAMRGGFEGVQYSVDETEFERVQDELHAELESVLRSRADEERPAGFILYPESIQFSYETDQAEAQPEGEVAIIEKVTLVAPLFEADSFASFLAQQTLLGYENEQVRIKDPETLEFSYAGTSTTASIDGQDSFDFTLQGQAEFVWTFDHEALALDLSGKSETALETVLTGYSAIERAQAEIRPFWKRSFPDQVNEIEIVETMDTQ